MRSNAVECKYCFHEDTCDQSLTFTKATESIEKSAKEIVENIDKDMSLSISMTCNRYHSKPDPKWSYCDGAS